jgi:hypothetical protein
VTQNNKGLDLEGGQCDIQISVKDILKDYPNKKSTNFPDDN